MKKLIIIFLCILSVQQVFCSSDENNKKAKKEKTSKHGLYIDYGFRIYSEQKGYCKIGASPLNIGLSYTYDLPFPHPINFYVIGGGRYLQQNGQSTFYEPGINIEHNTKIANIYTGIGYKIPFLKFLSASLDATIGYAYIYDIPSDFDNDFPLPQNLIATFTDKRINTFNYNFSLKIEANVKFVSFYIGVLYNAYTAAPLPPLEYNDVITQDYSPEGISIMYYLVDDKIINLNSFNFILGMAFKF